MELCFMAAWGEFNPTNEDVVRLAMLPLFGESNVMRVVLEVGEELKLKHITSAMTALRTSSKFTSVTFVCYID